MNDQFDDFHARHLLDKEVNLSQKGYNFPIRLQGTDGVRGEILLNSNNPLKDYVCYNKISPEFMEVYSYSWARLLLEEYHDDNNINKLIIIAYDPRDKTGKYLNKICEGILKSGLRFKIIGCLPTPAVQLSVLTNNAVGGIMLTASHNPANQHGIKLFNRFGLKYLPKYDMRLTSIINSIDYNQINNEIIPKIDTSIDITESSKFINLFKDKIDIHNNYCNFLLLFDCANGAVSNVIPKIFNNELNFNFKFINKSWDNPINEHCGIAEFEEVSRITQKEFIKKNSIWKKNKTVKHIFECSKNYEYIVGLIFDGDGDRFIALLYDRNSRSIKVLGGDEIASRIMINYNYSKRILINTIESDYNIDSYASRINWEVINKSIGDKWLGHACQKIKKTDQKTEIICYEESGHFIIPTKYNKEGNNFLIAGNGISTAIEFLKIDPNITTNYTKGSRLTYNIYFVDKSLLTNLSFKNQLQIRLKKLFAEYNSFQYKIIELKYEPELILLELYNQNVKIGRLFIRNSGTENKSSVNLRIKNQYYDKLKIITENIYIYLWWKLKDFEKIENKIIKIFLNQKDDFFKISKKYPRYFDELNYILQKKEQLITESQINSLGKRIIKNKKYAS